MQVAFFLPIILAMGGNVASQCSMVVVRGLSTGRLEFGRVGRVIGYELGAGLQAVEVSARDSQTGETVGSGQTVGEDGWFRIAVPAGTHHIDFWAHDDLDYFVQGIHDVEVWTDTLLYPAFQAEPSGSIQGTVYLEDGTTPVPGVEVSAFDAVSDHWIEGTGSCHLLGFVPRLLGRVIGQAPVMRFHSSRETDAYLPPAGIFSCGVPNNSQRVPLLPTISR